MQCRGFAASAGTQQNAKFFIVNVQIKAGYSLDLSKILTDIFQYDFRQVLASLIAINMQNTQLH